MSFRHPYARVHYIEDGGRQISSRRCIYDSHVTFLSLMSPTTFVARVHYVVVIVALIISHSMGCVRNRSATVSRSNFLMRHGRLARAYRRPCAGIICTDRQLFASATSKIVRIKRGIYCDVDGNVPDDSRSVTCIRMHNALAMHHNFDVCCAKIGRFYL